MSNFPPGVTGCEIWILGEDEIPADSAIDRIADILDGREWTADTLDAIADIVRAAGCTVSAPGEVEDGDRQAHLDTALRLTR